MYEKLQEMMAKNEEVKRIKETLLSWVKEEVDGGKQCFHVESVGQTMDMVKDLAETEKECAEALYYMTVVTAMLEGDEPEYGPMGYNHRHLNSGRFARSGRGHVVSGHGSSYGFHPGPFVDQEPFIDGYLHDPNEFRRRMNPRMGYDDGRDWDDKRENWDDRSGSKSKYGRAYDDYKEARRHYTVSKNHEDKEKMEHHIMEHVENALESMFEMWESSDDVMLKKRISDEAAKILNQMKMTK